MLEEIHKLWKHRAGHLKELHQMNENSTEWSHNNSTKFEIGQSFMVKNHVHHTFKPMYLLDCKVLQILNDNTIMLITPNGK